MKKSVRKTKQVKQSNQSQEMDQIRLEIFKKTSEKYQEVLEKLDRFIVQAYSENPKSDDLGIGAAIRLMKDGYKISKKTWNNPRIYLYINNDSTCSDEHWIGVKTVRGLFTPWCPSHRELMSTDWYIVKD